jgi:hypothetical protein
MNPVAFSAVISLYSSNKKNHWKTHADFVAAKTFAKSFALGSKFFFALVLGASLTSCSKKSNPSIGEEISKYGGNTFNRLSNSEYNIPDELFQPTISLSQLKYKTCWKISIDLIYGEGAEKNLKKHLEASANNGGKKYRLKLLDARGLTIGHDDFMTSDLRIKQYREEGLPGVYEASNHPYLEHEGAFTFAEEDAKRINLISIETLTD